MELVSSCFRTYKYLANEKSNDFFILEKGAEISDQYSIYDSLIDFLNFDLHSIRSALQSLYDSTEFRYDSFLTHFQTIKNELSVLFKIKDSSTNFGSELDYLTLQFISYDYTIFTIRQILSKRDAMLDVSASMNTEIIECFRDKYFRFLLGVYSLNDHCDGLINRGTMEELKIAFSDYYLCVEDLYYTKIYPEFYLHTTPSYAFSLYKPPYRLSLIKQKILESLSINIKSEELNRIESKTDQMQTKEEKKYLIKKESEIEQSEPGNPYKKWRYDFTSSPSEKNLYNYYTAGLEFGTNKNNSKKKDSITMPFLDYPIKIAVDFWYLNQESLGDTNPRDNHTINQKCYTLEYIEDIFVLHCSFLAQNKIRIGKCPGCHKIKYSANGNFSCGKKCADKHKQDIISNTPDWKNHENLRKQLYRRIKKISAFSPKNNLDPEQLKFIKSNFMEIQNWGYLLLHAKDKISSTDYDDKIKDLNYLSDVLYKIYKLDCRSHNGNLKCNQNIQEVLNEKRSFITNKMKALAPFFDSLKESSS